MKSMIWLNNRMDIYEIRRQRLRQLIRKDFDGNQLMFAKKTGIKAPQVNRWLSETTNDKRAITEMSARKIEEKSGKPRRWLDGVEVEEKGGLLLLDVTNNKIGVESSISNTTPADLGSRAIPVISHIQAGRMSEISDPYAPGDGSAVIYSDEDLSRWAFALQIEGDSMLPEFRPGDRVIIDPDIAPGPGDFVVAKNGREEATFKKYRPRGTGQNGDEIFELVPLNDDFPTMRSDHDHLKVIGVMVEHRKYRRK